MFAEQFREIFRFAERLLATLGVNGVLHRVGRQHHCVVAECMRVLEVTLEGDIDSEIANVVALTLTFDLDDAHRRLSVAAAGQTGRHRQLPRYVVKPNGLSKSGTW